MLSEPQRQTILELHAKGMGVRQIARTLGHARPTVRRVLAQGAARPPSSRPPAKRSPVLTSTLPGLYCEAQGNVLGVTLIRVSPTTSDNAVPPVERRLG